MRNLISFTVTSLVVACLVLLPGSGVRAEALAGGEDGGGEVSVGEDGSGSGSGGGWGWGGSGSRGGEADGYDRPHAH